MNKEKNIAWIYLILSGLLEIVWAYFLKASHGFTVLIPSLLTVFFIAVGFVLLERSVRVNGIGVSYGVFTGIGIVGTTLLGIFVLREGVTPLKVVSILVLVAGIIGLKFCSGKEVEES